MFRFLIALAFIFPGAASAHHSRANFDAAQRVEISGILTDFAWKNPHVYLEIETTAEDGAKQSWLVESHSVTGLRRNGWTEDSLTVGETVTLSGQPDRDPDKHFILMNYIERLDGTRLYAFGGGDRGSDASPPEPTPPSTDFSGTWDMDMRGFNIRLAGGGPPLDWPYTEAGRALAESYDAEENPELQCSEIGVPRIIIYPYSLNIVHEDDVITMEKEHLHETRSIWLDPLKFLFARHEPSYVGSSLAWFEGDRKLVILSDNFLPTAWGVTNGIDSSADKQVEETYVLAEDGESIEFSIKVTDPVYFTEPVIQTGRFFKSADRAFDETACDPVAASRHLDAD